MTFTGAMPTNGHPGGDGTTWTQPNNWDTAQVPGNGDDVTMPSIYTGTITGNPNVALHSLTLLQGTGTLQLDNPLTVAGSLTMHGGTISASNLASILTLQGGTSTWDGGTIGTGSMLKFKMNSGATLDVSGTVTLDCILEIGASSTSIGVCSLWGAYVDTTAAAVIFRVSAGGLLSLNAKPNTSPPLGSVIASDPNRPGWVDDQGSVVVAAGAGPAGTQTAHSVQMPILVTNGGVLSVDANTVLSVHGNTSQSFDVEAKGGKVNLGQPANGANPDGNAHLNCTLKGSHVDSASFLAAYGTQNTWDDPAGLGLLVEGTLRLALKHDTSWEQSTLEVTDGTLTLSSTSTFTLYGWHDVTAPNNTNCIYDWLKCDLGTLTIAQGCILNPFLAGTSDTYSSCNFSACVSVGAGQTLSVTQPFNIVQNMPPNAGAGAYWQGVFWAQFQTLDLVWHGTWGT